MTTEEFIDDQIDRLERLITRGLLREEEKERLKEYVIHMNILKQLYNNCYHLYGDNKKFIDDQVAQIECLMASSPMAVREYVIHLPVITTEEFLDKKISDIEFILKHNAQNLGLGVDIQYQQELEHYKRIKEVWGSNDEGY